MAELEKNKEYYLYTHTDSSINTLQELIQGITNPISICRGIDLGVLLRYEDEKGVTNLEKIWDKYPLVAKSEPEENKYIQNLEYLKQFPNDLEKSIPNPPNGFITKIYRNTTLAIPYQKLNRDTLIGEGNQIVDEDFEAFVADKLKGLLQDTKYYPLFKTEIKNIGAIKAQFPNMTVWLWCRSLSPIPQAGISNPRYGMPINESFLKKKRKSHRRGIDEDPLGGTIIDLTPFIDALNIEVNPQGGTFGFTLPPIAAEFNPELGWKIKVGSLRTYLYKGEVNYAAESIYEKSNGQLTDYYFHNIIGENDLIFIRLETLNNELKQRIKDKQLSSIETAFEIPKEELAGKIYDMIGLVDSNSISKDPGSNNVQINIQGRDLIKLFIEDSSVFVPLNFVPEGSYFSNEPDERLLNRIEGKLHTLAQSAEKTIDFSLKYIINTLSNMGVVPNDLFTSYVHQVIEGTDVTTGEVNETNTPKVIDERSYKFRLDIESRKKRVEKSNDLEERAKKIKDKIGKVRESEKIDDPYNSSEIADVFRTLQDFIKKGYEEKALNPKNSQNSIIGWDSFTFQDYKVRVDYLPPIFDYKLVTPSKYYTDEKGRKMSYNDALREKEGLLNDLNDYFKKLNKFKLKIDVAPFDQDEPPPSKLTQRDFAEMKQKQDVNEFLVNLQEEQNYINQSQNKRGDANQRVQESLPYNKFLEDLKKEENKNNQKELKRMKDEYARLQGKYKGFKVFFHIDPRTYSSLNSQTKEVLNETLEYVILNNQEEAPDKYTQELCEGAWQIVKLVIDDEVQQRRLVDNSIGNESGSIINHLRKICQDPFVELYTDTYKDQFYMCARKPPFIRKKIEEHLAMGLILNIERGDILRMNLNFNQGLGYSMYRITPQSAFMGGNDAITWAYLKAIYFPELADIYGLKFMDQVSQYIPHFPLINEGRDLGSEYAIEQATLDLQYIIETNMYLPFTREGQITLIGDRRFKRGTWVRIVETEEIGYVETVANSIVKSEGVDRTTTLTLNRIIKEKYLDYYFGLINLDIKEKISKYDSYEQWIKDTVGNWKVNKSKLNFLLRREQFQ